MGADSRGTCVAGDSGTDGCEDGRRSLPLLAGAHHHFAAAQQASVREPWYRAGKAPSRQAGCGRGGLTVRVCCLSSPPLLLLALAGWLIWQTLLLLAGRHTHTRTLSANARETHAQQHPAHASTPSNPYLTHLALCLCRRHLLLHTLPRANHDRRASTADGTRVCVD